LNQGLNASNGSGLKPTLVRLILANILIELTRKC